MEMRAFFINSLFFIMNSREILVLKTLERKALLSGSDPGAIVDHLLEQNPDQADALTKNVCARIPKQLAERMEQIGSFLEINKRVMITYAIQDFLDKAVATLDEFDAWPKAEEAH